MTINNMNDLHNRIFDNNRELVKTYERLLTLKIRHEGLIKELMFKNE